MKITDLVAYKKIIMKFESGEFHSGNASKLPIYSYDERRNEILTPGHYVDAINYSKIHFEDIPQEYRTRDFFLHALSSVHKDVLNYVKDHIGEEFDREFFKDHIATDKYSLEFEENCFEYMPLDYIDEEMVSCAFLKSVEARLIIDRRNETDAWFYSVAKRKPEVLTQDFWKLGARLFSLKRNGENKFLEITPMKYRTHDYYLYMCLNNNTPVMEDFPQEIITNNFLIVLFNENVENIKTFSNEALEREVPVRGKGEMKIWQAAILTNGCLISDIPLNEERVKFFIEHYDKDSWEYKYCFYDAYHRWLRTKEAV